jgi:hypothetical protein
MNQTSVSEEKVSDEPTCLWCPYTGTLKQVLLHMESAHHRQWCDLALSPLVAGRRLRAVRSLDPQILPQD